MLNNNNIKSALDFTKTIADTDIYPLSKRMDSGEINSMFLMFEDRLNYLYEKIRTLEDINEYCLSVAIKEIEKKRKALKATIKKIENNIDALLSKEYVANIIDFNTVNNMPIKDRDGATLPQCQTSGTCLVVPHQTLCSTKPTAIRKKSGGEYYQQWFDSQTGTYQVIYTKDSPESVTEEVTLEFQTPITANMLELEPLKCTIEQIVIKDVNDGIETIMSPQGNQVWFNGKIVKEIDIKIKGEAYSIESTNISLKQTSGNNALLTNATSVCYDTSKGVADCEEPLLNQIVATSYGNLVNDCIEQAKSSIQQTSASNFYLALLADQKIVNKKTGEVIEAKDVISGDDSGLVVLDNSAFKFVSSQDLEIMKAEDAISDVTPEHMQDDVKVATKKYIFSLGLANIVLKHATVYPAAGFVSQPIEITDCSYIDLEADFTLADGSVEFYIVDGNEEIAIMPAGYSTIGKERLFYGLPLRFEANNNAQTVIRLNNMVVYKTLEEAAANANNGLYTVSYAPLNIEKAQKYIPVNSTIKLKAIMRNYGDMPALIKSLTIKQHRGISSI